DSPWLAEGYLSKSTRICEISVEHYSHGQARNVILVHALFDERINMLPPARIRRLSRYARRSQQSNERQRGHDTQTDDAKHMTGYLPCYGSAPAAARLGNHVNSEWLIV